MSDFPVVLTAAVDGVPGIGTPIVAKHLNNLENKVGIDSSADPASLDYGLRNPSSIDPGHVHSALSGNLLYYLSDTASDVGGYKKQLTTPGGTRIDESIAPGNGTHVLHNFITEPGFPGVPWIPAGSFEFHVHASRASGPFTIYAEFWETDAAGADIAKIGTTEQAVVGTSETEYRIYFAIPDVYMMASTASRIVCRVWAITSSGATCHLYVGGEADAHIAMPSNVVDATNFVPYSGATADVNLGTHNLLSKNILSGWIPVTDTWTYASADAPTFTFTIPGDQTGLLSPGMRIRLTQTTVKYFIITAVSYGSPNTTVTVYGGTDYTLVSAAITAPYFSLVKAPYGFPLDPSKWTVQVVDTTNASQSSPNPVTWYNLGSISISVPIGIWNLTYECCAIVNGIPDMTELISLFTLSTSDNSESDSQYTCIIYTDGYPTAGNILTVAQNVRRRKTVALTSKTTYYLIMQDLEGTISALNYAGTFSPTIITAICAYL